MWKRVVWSDESKFNIFNSDRKTYIRRRGSEKFNKDHTGMLLRVDTTTNADRYLQVLEDGMIPSAWAARLLDFIFMHDNTPCH